ncbi:MAG: hypothetical protein AAF806_05650 [Bacteroidota bacterium]
MKRLHLFEWEDQEWMPISIRNYITDFLQFLSNKFKIYDPIAPILAKAMLASHTNQMIDLASGGGGGLISLNEALRKMVPNLKIWLTDYFPNIPAFEYTKKQADNIDYVSTSVDARNVPKDLKGLRTQFLSLHHFRPSDAQKILQTAVDANQSIAIFEVQERSITSFISTLFSPIMVLLTTPFIRPFKLGRIVFTYIIPIVPLIVLWDGMVSILRTYSVAEMQALVDQLTHKDRFDWEIRRLKTKRGVVLYLLGTDKLKHQEVS